MVVIKNAREIEGMKKAGALSAQALALAGQAVKPGVTTAHIDALVKDFICSHGAAPSFLNYNGYPASACISINNVVIHGIPSHATVIKEGDIVSIDVGAFLDGFHGDNAATFAAGEVSQEAQKLMDVTRQSLTEGIKMAQAGNRVGDISAAVQTCVEQNGFAVVTQFVGHGVGKKLHEDPEVPNFGTAGRGVRLMPGMTIAIEPMVNAAGPEVRILADNWTTVTVSGSLSAHFEHSVLITKEGPVILTTP